MDFSFASASSTAENQRLKLSALICGLRAADNRCHSCAHFLSIGEVVNSVTETPHGPVAWEIARRTWPIIELFPSMIQRSIVQKHCQKGVNTRGNGLSRRTVCVYYDALAHAQSILLARSFQCCSSLLSEISQTCSQLIHTRFVAALASGLETRNQLRKRQEKNEFYFQLCQKNFLDWKNEARASSRKQKTVWLKEFREPTATDFESQREHPPTDRRRIPS